MYRVSDAGRMRERLLPPTVPPSARLLKRAVATSPEYSGEGSAYHTVTRLWRFYFRPPDWKGTPCHGAHPERTSMNLQPRSLFTRRKTTFSGDPMALGRNSI
jgi:hypothetical protein